jgi:hypothetical protein
MRFASVPLPKAEPQRSPAAEFVRRLLGSDKVAGEQPLPVPQVSQEGVPADLDQRVRLVGEW